MKPKLFALALSVALTAALLVPAVSSADSPIDRVDGGGSIIPPTDISAPSQFEVGASSGPLGEDPTGHITDRVVVDEAGPRTLHGDVRAGCLHVMGNRAVVVGRLPDSEQFDLPGVGRIEYVALVIEDNGNPADGQPVDRAVDFILRAVGAERFCTVFDPALAPFFPLNRGDFIVSDGAVG
jgi:hypothetical protein